MTRLSTGTLVLLIVCVVLTGCSTPASNRSGTESGLGTIKSRKARKADLEAQAALENHIRAQAHFATALHFDLNEQPDLAFEHYYKAAVADPSYEPVVMEAARRALANRQPDKAIEILSRALQKSDASGGLHAWLGIAYAQAGDTNRAIFANQTAIQKSPQFLAPYQNLAHLYLQTSRPAEALQLLDEAARQPVEDPAFLIDLAELFGRFERTQAVPEADLKARIRKALDRAAELEPDHPLHLQKLGEAYFALGEFEKAEHFYAQLLDEFPELPAIRAKLMDIYLRTGNKEKASEQLLALSREDPTNPQTYVFLGAPSLEDKKPAEAAEYFERALLLNPDLEPVYYELAAIRLSQEKPDEALALLEKAREKFKPNFVLEFYSGAVQAVRKNYSEAIRHFRAAEIVAKANEPARLNQMFYYQLGSAYERAGMYEDAEATFRKVLQMAPDYADAMNYLGYMWAELGIKLDEALALTKRAVELEPENAAFLDSLAWVHYKLGNHDEALLWMLKAIQHSEEADATLYDHLGDVYSALNQPEKARAAWKRSLEVEANEQIEEKLRAGTAIPEPN